MTAVVALVVYCVWIVALTLALVAWRIVLVQRREFQWKGFTSGERHGPPAYWRLNRVHSNALENVGLFAALVLVGEVSGATSPAWGVLATCIVAARVVQGVIHLRAQTNRAVVYRGYAFLTQQFGLLAMAAWLLVL